MAADNPVSSLPTIDLRNIRPHDGRKDRGWEELAYLLARESKGVPSHATWERRGTPDGGIEFSCTFKSGDRTEHWAWQAKYLFSLDDRAFNQMARSFTDALTNHPDMTRYTFVLPINRPGGATGESAMKKWHRYVVKWKKQATELGRTVDIEYVGESETVIALQPDQHAGTVRYFFDATFLTTQTFKTIVGRAVDNLGDRYERTADVGSNVDEVLDAVGLRPRFVARLRELGVRVAERARTATNTLARAGLDGEHLSTSADEFCRLHEECVLLAADGQALSFGRLVNAATELTVCVKEMINSVLDLAELPLQGQVPQGGGAQATVPTRDEVWSTLYRVEDAARELTAVVDGDSGRAAERGIVLLVGSAGSGKSHTLAAHCESRVAKGRPSLLALGQHLTVAPSLWNEVISSMEMSYSYHDLLLGLETAANVGRHGRALIVVDAVNEGAGQDLWESRVAGFMSEVAKHPRVGLILSVRDTYEKIVLPPKYP